MFQLARNCVTRTVLRLTKNEYNIKMSLDDGRLQTCLDAINYRNTFNIIQPAAVGT